MNAITQINIQSAKPMVAKLEDLDHSHVIQHYVIFENGYDLFESDSAPFACDVSYCEDYGGWKVRIAGMMFGGIWVTRAFIEAALIGETISDIEERICDHVETHNGEFGHTIIADNVTNL